jgi:glycosyltransferase involved in cell wall biosynthesis
MRRSLMVFVDWFEPGYKAGGPVQSSKNLALAMTGEFDVYIVCSDRDLHDEAPYEGIEPFVWQPYRDHVRVYYAAPGSMGLRRIRRLIREKKPSCLFVNGMFSPGYSVLPVLAGRLEGVQTVVSPRGMLQHGSMRFKRTKKKAFLFLMRVLGLHRNTMFQATDEQESEDVKSFFPSNGGLRVIPNLLNPEHIDPFHTPKSPGELSLVFLSRISRKKNLDFLLRVLSGLPDDNSIRLTVAGQVEEPDYWEDCAGLIARLPSHISVDVVGPVPNRDLSSFYRQFHAFILPTHGENFGHAILEAMLNSKPVVISDRTPWTGLEERKAGYVIPLQDIEGYRRAIRNLASCSQSDYYLWADGAYEFSKGIQNANDRLVPRYIEMFS